MNKVLPFLLLLFVFTSCSCKYKIEGASSVTSLDGIMLFIKVLQNGEWLNIDSAEVVHGLFSMKGKVDSVVMATLYIGDESIMPLVIEKGNIQVSITNTELVAKGTALNNALYAFIDKKNSYLALTNRPRESIAHEYQPSRHHPSPCGLLYVAILL